MKNNKSDEVAYLLKIVMDRVYLKQKLTEICSSIAWKQKLADEPNLEIEELGEVAYARVRENLKINSQSMIYLAGEIIKIFEEKQKNNIPGQYDY